MSRRIPAVFVAVVLLVPAAAGAQRSGWVTNAATNPLDDSKTVVARLAATEGTGGVFAQQPIVLIARCQSNTTEVYFNWHEFLGLDDTLVTYRFPPAAATTVTWRVSTDNQATFVRGAIPFLRTLLQSERLVVQTTPHGESPITAIFELGDAEAAVASIAEECGWILDADEARRVRAARQAAAERAAEEARAAREAERRTRDAQLAALAGQSFPLADVYDFSSRDGGTYARGGLPVGVFGAWFPGLEPADLIALKRAAGSLTYSCAESRRLSRRGNVELFDCVLSAGVADAASQERIAALIGGSFTLSDLSVFASVPDVGAYAARGLPDGVTRAVFPGMTVTQLIDLQAAAPSATYSCSEVAEQQYGLVELHGCTVTE